MTTIPVVLPDYFDGMRMIIDRIDCERDLIRQQAQGKGAGVGVGQDGDIDIYIGAPTHNPTSILKTDSKIQNQLEHTFS